VEHCRNGILTFCAAKIKQISTKKKNMMKIIIKKNQVSCEIGKITAKYAKIRQEKGINHISTTCPAKAG
jgi:hypothetical protein